jgi:hypothetical protein
MEYKPFMVAFIKASTQNEYRFRVYALTGDQAVSYARSKLSKKLGEGEFKLVDEGELR